MRYAHILSRVTGEPWLITEPGGSAVVSLLNSRLATEPLPHVMQAPLPPPPPRPLLPPRPATGLAVVRARGILGKNLGSMEMMCGGLDVDTLLNEIEGLLMAPEIGTVAMHLDSPGGAATGIPEAHQRLVRLRAQYGKPLLAVVDGLCASAAMYLAAACDSIACTRTAQLGSIGAVTHLRFRVGMNAAEGLEVRTYKYGKFKDLGNPNRLPTPEEDAIMQERINTLGRMFESDMRSARPQMKDEVYDALVYFGEQAVALGLADELTDSVEDYLATIAKANV